MPHGDIYLVDISWHNGLLPEGTWINFDPTWMNDCIHYKVWDEMTNAFPKFSGAVVEVWEWTSNFILQFTRCVLHTKHVTLQLLNTLRP